MSTNTDRLAALAEMTNAAGDAFNNTFHKCRAEVSMDWWQRIWAQGAKWAWEHPASDTPAVPAGMSDLIYDALECARAAARVSISRGALMHVFDVLRARMDEALSTAPAEQAPSTPAPDVSLSARIDELIEQHGSLRAAARELDCDPGYLSRLASGEKTDPGTTLLLRMGLRSTTTYQRMKS